MGQVAGWSKRESLLNSSTQTHSKPAPLNLTQPPPGTNEFFNFQRPNTFILRNRQTLTSRQQLLQRLAPLGLRTCQWSPEAYEPKIKQQKKALEDFWSAALLEEAHQAVQYARHHRANCQSSSSVGGRTSSTTWRIVEYLSTSSQCIVRCLVPIWAKPWINNVFS